MGETKNPNTDNLKKAESRGQICENLSFAAKEAFKRLRANVTMAFPENELECKIIGVTSAQPSEGKSTVSLNLSFSLAELGKKVLLLDADMRRPSIHVKVGINKTPGLSNLLRTSNAIAATIRNYKSTKNNTAFDIIPGGDVVQNPSELLGSKRMDTLLHALASAYDYIIIDLPPVGAVIDAVTVSKKTDGMLVVIRENNCPRGVFSDCIDQLKRTDINILGFVVNGALEGAGKKYQYSNYY
ncbi:MAG: CpsD/CapB family tyrosine-protein kinase [Eubacteriales bacterium]|nr:CpsD/CapB family tyrosine-protein kinase [Eubacteriales bacterium]